MAKIFITGYQKPITVSKSVALQVQAFKEDMKVYPNERFKSEDFNVEKRDIRLIIVNDYEDNTSEGNDGRKAENEKYYAEEEKKYQKTVEARCFIKPEVKAKDTRLMELIYQSITGELPTQEFKDEVVKRQAEYFTRNPKHPYASVNIKDLMPSQRRLSEGHVSEIFHGLMVKKAYNIMDEALKTAKRMRIL